MHRRTLILTAAAGIAASALPGFASGVRTIGGDAFGSWWRAVLPAGANPEQVRAAIEAVIGSVDASMSPFRASSEVVRLNGDTGRDWYPVSPGTAEVVAESLRLGALTGGAFDPTVGPLVHRYGFGPVEGGFGGGYVEVELREKGIRKARPDVTLDLCGAAKGYALDEMARALERLGLDAFILEAGGEVLARGAHPEGRNWQVAIETASSGPLALQRIVRLDGWALATSGDSVNGGRAGGARFNHLIDPRTRRPVDNGVASVSVIDRSAMRADALATGLFVMGPDKGLELAEQRGLAVLFQIHDGTSVFELRSPMFDRFIVA